ncbi:MAG: hypothetical protein A2Z88_05460 [Omnitrophica WOR_2 bacterium GWA2_47_8]|nr:MAG: hypothetical protein A2Z88_05460 [Omnitrophica WOR_2 bacterium GWA2_47_8]
MVADFCEFSLDNRFLPFMKNKYVLDEVKKIIRSVTPRFKIIIDDLQQPYEINARHPFVKQYLQTAKRMKQKTRIKASEGATVITFFKRHNIPAFATGYGSSGTAHTTDEYVSINNLYKGSQLLEQYLKDYDGRY